MNNIDAPREPMGKFKKITILLVKNVGFYIGNLLKVAKKVLVLVSKIARKYLRKYSKYLHHHIAVRPHHHLKMKFQRYDRWHCWRFHKHVHLSVLVVYLAVIGALVLGSIGKVRAASDLFDIWDFSDPVDYTLDSGIEIVDSKAKLKAQNYTSDANTVALYHLDETSGTIASDSSANSNNATISGSTSWIDANLNNGLSLNGSDSYLSAPDSGSLSFSQNHSIEAWTKFNSDFSAGSHNSKQGIVDKGSYRLYHDQETGKVTYELANASSTTWTQQAGNDIKGSWDINGKFAVTTQEIIGTDLYAGLGNVVGDAEVWKYNGSNWSQVGGDGVNSGWAGSMFENVTSMESIGTTLYAGLGSTAGDGEVWSCNTASNCTSWTKIGGDGINNGWPVNSIEEVTSMTTMNGILYVGLGNSANDARVYSWNGSSWTWIGGFGITGSYNAFPTGYEAVYGMTNDGTNLYVSFGLTAGDADVWRLTGTTWTQIGGDGINSSWAASTFEAIYALHYFDGNLYAGLGISANNAEVWRWNGTSWTKIGGDSLNSGWTTNYEGVYSITDDGTNIYAGLGLTAGDNEVWRWNGTSWTKIGGDALNGSFTNTHTIVRSLAFGNGLLYAGLLGTANNAETWSWNGTTWTLMGGGFINNSWGGFNLQNVESMTISGDYLYAGTGNTVAGNALVWRFDGNNWVIVGGQGLNGSWPAKTYENVLSMLSFGGNLYAGLGTTANDAEVWRYNGSTWTQIGGDSINSSWAAGFEEVSAMANLGGSLYVGLGNSANDAEVWRWNGTSWTKIGGDSLNSGWTTNYDRVSSLGVYRGELYAGLGLTATEAEVWRYNGTVWSKIGGDGVSSSWNNVYEQVESLTPYNGRLYAGLGNSTGDAEVWEYNGSTWSQVGGDGLNSSWLDGQFEQVKSMVTYNGKLYAGLGLTAGDGEVWEFDGSAWNRMGGSDLNSSWSAGAKETVRSFSVYKGKLYAGLGDSANVDASIWSYGNNGFLQSTADSQDTEWHHIAATYNGTTMKIYIDGVLSAQTNAPLTIPDNDRDLLIGSTYGTSETGWRQGYFNGSLDEIRISNIERTSFTTLPFPATPQAVTLTEPVRTSGVSGWDNMLSSDSTNGGTVTYRLSDDDGSTWKYWDGSTWTASASLAQSNSIDDIDDNINTFPITFYGIRWQAVLSGNGDQQVELNSLTLQSTSDVAEPSPNASALRGFKTNGGTELNSNDWTNGSSPFFSWDSASDGGSGLKGYCIYLGQDENADPTTTKGLLGTSPVYTANRCQFIIEDNELDLSTPGLIGTPLTTSNDPYYILVRAIDKAGNISADSESFHFRFDNTPPTNPGFITAPSGFINTKNTTLTWPTTGGQAISDVGSGTAGLQYRINNSAWYGDNHSGTGDNQDLLVNDGSYTTVDPIDYNNINEGINLIYFRTWDNAGNVTPGFATATLKINTAGAPSEPQNVQASPSTNTANAFSFSWQKPTTFIGSENNLSYCYSINTLPNINTCTFTSGGITSLGSGPYATQPGVNTFYVVARDESSNINYSSYSTVDFTANTTAPGIATNTDIVDVSIKSTSNWRLALTWDEPEDTGAGVSTYRIYRSINNTNFSFVGSSTSTTYIDANLSQQTYYYKVRACDSTNNCGADSSTVEMLPTGKFTTPALLTGEPTVSDITTKKAVITWVTDRESDSKVAIGTTSGQYSSSEIGNSTQTNLHTIQLDNLSAGTTYYYIAKWTDEDGNTGTSQEFSFTTSPAPVIKEVQNTAVSLSGTTIVFTSKSASKVNLYFGASESFGGLKTINTSQAESQYSFNLDGLSDGTKYFYRLSAFDSEGGEYLGNIFSFTTPPRPRITNLRFQPISGEPTSTQLVTWQTNVPSTSMVTYGKVGSSGIDIQISNPTTEHEIKINNLEDDSEYFILAQSRDIDGNLAVSDRQQFRTALDTRSPVIRDITIESSIRGTGAEARGQVVVSWKTDEPSMSQVAYAEGSKTTVFNSRTAEDTQLTTDHLVIVSDLPTSKVYSIQPLSKDKSGNVGQGEIQSAIIGRASESVLTIILNTLQKVFGF